MTSPASTKEQDLKNPIMSPRVLKSDLVSNSGYSQIVKNQQRLTSAYGSKATTRSDSASFHPPNITAFRID